MSRRKKKQQQNDEQVVNYDNKNRNNGKPDGNGKPKGQAPKGKCKSYDQITTNDIRWWNKATELYERATNIPFARQSGVPLPVTEITGSGYEKIFNIETQVEFSTGARATLPMGQLFEYVPTIGVSNSDNSGPNRAFQAMASAIYSKTTGSLPFPQYVLGLMNLAVQSIAQNIALVKRALDTSYSYSYSNTALPRVLLSTQGIEPDSVLGKQNDIIFALDDVIRDFNALHFPSYMDAFERHYSLARNIWWDAADPMGQFFIFRPFCYYVYSDLGNVIDEGGETTYDGVARCVAMPMPYRRPGYNSTDSVDINAIIDVVRQQIGALKNSDDYWTVRGAMGRVFSEGQFMTIDAYQPSTVKLTVDQNMMWQIANFDYAGAVKFGSRIFPNISLGTPALEGLDITGDPVSNILISEPKLRCREFEDHALGEQAYIGGTHLYTLTNVIGDKHSLNSQSNNPSKEFVMEATRLKCRGEIMDVDPMIDTGDWAQPGMYVAIRSCGTELIVGSYIIYLVGEGDNPEAPGAATAYHVPWTPLMLIEPSDGPTLDPPIKAMVMPWRYAASTFYLRSVELFQAVEANDDGDTFSKYERIAALGDIYNYTYLSNNELNNLHRAALLSAYTTDTPVGN